MGMFEANEANEIPIKTKPRLKQLDTWLEPPHVYWALTQSNHTSPSFLLESQKKALNEPSFSFVLTNAFGVLKTKGDSINWEGPEGLESIKGDALEYLRAKLNMYMGPGSVEFDLPFCGGAVGLFSFELKNSIESYARILEDPYELPDIHMGFFNQGFVFNHTTQCVYAFDNAGVQSKIEFEAWITQSMQKIRQHPLPIFDTQKVDIDTEVNRYFFESNVIKAKELIRQGEVYQVNLSHVLEFAAPKNLFGTYLKQREVNPSGFASFADFGDYQLISGSPERLIRLRGNRVDTRPIAGTRPCSKDSDEDRRLNEELFISPKERAEHVMLVDLERNDIGRVCEYGSVQVSEFMICEEYSHVRHIVSNITGQLNAQNDVIDLIRAVFPGGTITGAPKKASIGIIDSLEAKTRGPYTGSLGYIGFDGDCDLNIIIRTLLIQNNRAYLQVGAGIVADSKPSQEYDETIHKAQAFLEVFQK